MSMMTRIKNAWNTGKFILPAIMVAVITVITLSHYKASVYEVIASQSAEEVTEELKEEEEIEELKEEEEKTKKISAVGKISLEDGIYRGRATGYGGQIVLDVQIQDQAIKDISIVNSESEDMPFFNRAKRVIYAMIENQSVDVDTVSGATYSSRGIINAVKNAIYGETDTQNEVVVTAIPKKESTKLVKVTENQKYKDGSYTGMGEGFGGIIKAQVVIKNGKITEISVLEAKNEDEDYYNKAIALIDNMIKNQSTNVDAISGATFTSNGIIVAVRDALSKAVTSEEQISQEESTSDSEDQSQNISGAFPYLDGIYYGTGEGYAGNITVGLALQDKTIKAIIITETVDDIVFIQRAEKIIPLIINQQNTDVDAVSGATYSSNGIISAIKKALLEAKKVTKGKSSSTDGDPSSSNGEQTDEGSDTIPSETNDTENDADSSNDTAEDLYNSNETTDNTNLLYNDGTYNVIITCYPDEDYMFYEYDMSLSVTIKNDLITGISNLMEVGGDGSNDTYINRAANGTSSVEGVVSQILESGTRDNIDAVSRATCSSNAIIEGCKTALDNAKKKE